MGTLRSKSRAIAARRSGLATARKGGAYGLSCVLSQAFNVSSGPMPDGSACVKARGRMLAGSDRAIKTSPSTVHDHGSRAQFLETAFAVGRDMRRQNLLRDRGPRRAIVLGRAFGTHRDHFQSLARALRRREMARRSFIEQLAETLSEFD